MRPVDYVHRYFRRARSNYVAAFEMGDPLFDRYGITTPLRFRHFLTQVAHESGGLLIEWESGNYSAQRLYQIFGNGRHSAQLTWTECLQLARNGQAIFERVYGLGNPRKARELGNTRAGDGWRFRGGGLMQTTGGDNYRRISDKTGVDFYNHPELILSPEHALKPALVEWDEGNLNALADANKLLAISRAINLGNPNSKSLPNGWQDRQNWYDVLKINTLELDSIGGTNALTS